MKVLLLASQPVARKGGGPTKIVYCNINRKPRSGTKALRHASCRTCNGATMPTAIMARNASDSALTARKAATNNVNIETSSPQSCASHLSPKQQSERTPEQHLAISTREMLPMMPKISSAITLTVLSDIAGEPARSAPSSLEQQLLSSAAASSTRQLLVACRFHPPRSRPSWPPCQTVVGDLLYHALL